MSKDIRRYHKQRMKDKAKKIYPYDYHGKNADNLAVCSCINCGNPRKFFKKITEKERVFVLNFKEQIADLYNHNQ